MTLPVAAVVACVGGVDNPAIPQYLQPDSGGSTTGGSTNALVGLYKLSTFNGNTLPDTIINDAFANADSTRNVTAILDSAELQLDSDSTVIEKDYFILASDIRQGTGLNPDTPSFSFGYGGTSDSVICTGGQYLPPTSPATATAFTQMSCFTFSWVFTRLATTYNYVGDSLSGSVIYQYFDSAAALGQPDTTITATMTWDYSGPATISAQHGTGAPAGTIRKGRRVIITHQ
jgi:hypothetical protein